MGTSDLGITVFQELVDLKTDLRRRGKSVLPPSFSGLEGLTSRLLGRVGEKARFHLALAGGRRVTSQEEMFKAKELPPLLFWKGKDEIVRGNLGPMSLEGAHLLLGVGSYIQSRCNQKVWGSHLLDMHSLVVPGARNTSFFQCLYPLDHSIAGHRDIVKPVRLPGRVFQVRKAACFSSSIKRRQRDAVSLEVVWMSIAAKRIIGRNHLRMCLADKTHKSLNGIVKRCTMK